MAPLSLETVVCHALQEDLDTAPVQVTGHHRAVPLLPEQAHASPFRLSHSPLAPSAGLEPATTRSDGGCSVRDHGAAWNATTPCATRWPGPTTSSTMAKECCWIAVQCSPVDLIRKCLRRSRIRRCRRLRRTGSLGRFGASPRNNSSPVGRKIRSALLLGALPPRSRE